MGSDIPKQFLVVDNKPIIVHTVEIFNDNPNISGIIVVCKKEYIDNCKAVLYDNHLSKVMDVIPGGETGQLSIYAGVKYLWEEENSKPEDIVLVHDGVRPCIDDALIDNSIESVKKYGNSIAVANAVETIIRVDDDNTILQENRDKITIYFFLTNGKQIYIDINKNTKFYEVINQLKEKYEWLYSVKIKRFIYNNKEIDFGKTCEENGIKDSALISIIDE